MSETRLRILVAEDNREALLLTTTLLQREHDVEGAADAATALRLMVAHPYDMLVTDLNMDTAGAGLLLAGAMRALQPGSRTVLLTGFPDFTRALASMQASLDLTVIKPDALPELRNLARASTGPGQAPPHFALGIWTMLKQRQADILQEWLKLVEADATFKIIPLNPVERMDHMEDVIADLVSRRPLGELKGALLHGRVRNLQGYRPELVTMELSYLRRAIFASVLRSLLELDLSTFPQDLFEIDTHLDFDMLLSLRSFGLQAPS